MGDDMRLRNKKTGEIVNVDFRKIYENIKTTRVACNIYWNKWYKEKHGYAPDCQKPSLKPEDVLEKFCYDSLAELNAEWDDYEEQKEEDWYINEDNEPQRVGFSFPIEDIKNLEEIGLLFKTKEETEKAIEKLKAYKRLKDKGFAFKYLENNSIVFDAGVDIDDQHIDDMNLLFGGKE